MSPAVVLLALLVSTRGLLAGFSDGIDRVGGSSQSSMLPLSPPCRLSAFVGRMNGRSNTEADRADLTVVASEGRRRRSLLDWELLIEPDDRREWILGGGTSIGDGIRRGDEVGRLSLPNGRPLCCMASYRRAIGGSGGCDRLI